MATRILYVITKANWGGAQRYVFDLALAAKEAGHTVTVAYGEEGRLVKEVAAEAIPTVAVRGLRRDIGLWSEYRAFKELRRLFRIEMPDVVHLNSSKAGLVGALAAKTVGAPRIIFTAHGWAFNEPRPWWQKMVLRLASGAIVLLSDTVICVSDATRRDIAWVPFSSRKLVTVHNGIRCTPPLPRSEARAALASSLADAYWIGMLSELHPTKRVRDAVLAFSHIAATHRQAALVIIGEGEEHEHLRSLIKELGLTDRVFLLGFIANAQKFLSAFDLFVHSSQSEALAYAILEAGCASLPVVATSVGGIPEIIRDGTEGLLVRPRDPAAIARALESLILDPARAKSFGATLHTRVVTEFSKEKMVRATLSLYY